MGSKLSECTKWKWLGRACRKSTSNPSAFETFCVVLSFGESVVKGIMQFSLLAVP